MTQENPKNNVNSCSSPHLPTLAMDPRRVFATAAVIKCPCALAGHQVCGAVTWWIANTPYSQNKFPLVLEMEHEMNVRACSVCNCIHHKRRLACFVKTHIRLCARVCTGNDWTRGCVLASGSAPTAESPGAALQVWFAVSPDDPKRKSE